MRGAPSSFLLGPILCSGAAGAAAQDKDGGAVQVNGIRTPETHTCRAIAAGRDAFDARHALAPDAPQLLFQARTRAGQSAWDAHADPRLSKQRSDVRVWPYVRSPGLPDVELAFASAGAPPSNPLSKDAAS